MLLFMHYTYMYCAFRSLHRVTACLLRKTARIMNTANMASTYISSATSSFWTVQLDNFLRPEESFKEEAGNNA